MALKFFLISWILLNNFVLLNACECEHIYPPEIIAEVESEYDLSHDDNLYGINPNQNNVYNPDMEKLLQKAAYAFDTFKYEKCLEYIKEYEKYFSPRLTTMPNEKKLIILAYKAYSARYLKKYDSAIENFKEMINLSKKTDLLPPECKFITYLEHAYCYLLKGNKRAFQERITAIIEMDIAPRYEYYKEKEFTICHQPCFHNHPLSKTECFIFNALTPELLGANIIDAMTKNNQTPPIYSVSDIMDDKEFCHLICARASYVTAMIIACISNKNPQAILSAMALGELLLECEKCCDKGWGSQNCLKNIKSAFTDKYQNLLEDLKI